METHRRIIQEETLYHKNHFIAKLNDAKAPEGYQLQTVFLGRKISGHKIFGEYWLEAMDPQHRYLLPWLLRYEQYPMGANDDMQAFFSWLEDQDVPDDCPRVEYLSASACDNAVVIPSSAQVIFQNSGVVCSLQHQQEYLFVIDIHKRLMILPGSERYHHSSLSHCRPTLGSGMITIAFGYIREISFYCGHYLPSKKDGLQALKIMVENGFTIKDDVLIKYFDDNGQKQEPFGVFYENSSR